MTIFNSFSNLDDSFKEMEEKWKTNYAKKQINKSNNEFIKEQKEEQRVESRYFDLLKNLTILSATVFSSSIALSSNKSLNYLYILGELFLLMSTIFGILFLLSQLKSLEWSHFFNVVNRLKREKEFESELIKQYIGNGRDELIQSYEKLMNKKGISYYILNIISVDWLPSLFYSFLSIGLLLIWVSLLF